MIILLLELLLFVWYLQLYLFEERKRKVMEGAAAIAVGAPFRPVTA